MKKKITALLAGIFTLVITTHAQAPHVDSITATPAVICPGGTVQFNIYTTDYPNSWTWYMPGSSMPYFVDTVINSPGNPPPVKYMYPGTYNIKCVVANASGSDSATVSVKVNSLPTAVIMPPSGGICDVDANGNALDTVFFTLIDTTRGNKYLWSPAGDLTCSTCTNPGAFPGTYTVFTLEIAGLDGCTALVYDTVTVGKILVTVTGKDSICAGFADTLIASGGSVGGSNRSSNNPQTTYAWSNGATTSSIIVKPNVTTTYNVRIVSGNGPCTDDTNYTVNVFPVPHFSYVLSPRDSICIGQTASFTLLPGENSPYRYSWYGPPYGRIDTGYFVVSPTVTTVYTLVVRNIGCYFDSLIKIKVNYPPKVHFTGPTDLCQYSQATITAYGGLQYHWSNGATTSSINVTAVVSTTYTVDVSSGNCIKDTSFTYHVDTAPSYVYKGDTSICVGQSTTIYAVPPPGHSSYGYSYLWNQGSTGDSVYTGPLTSPGAYPFYVVVTKGACSKDSGGTEAIVVKVYPLPKPKLWPADTQYCEYVPIPLTATGGDYYKWSASPTPGAMNHTIGYGDTDVNYAAPAVTTKYTVKVCTWGCCTGDTGLPLIPPSASTTINIIQGVQGYNVCCDTTVTGGTPVNLSATFDPGPYYVEGWTPSAGLSCNTCPNPTATVYSTTTYVATFLDQQNGCAVSDSLTIDIFNCNVFIPNVFSPNGDGVNDYLYVRSLCLKSMDFAVFDRWGNEVFETHDQNSPWDGRYKGKDMEMGTYIWYLSGLQEDGTHIQKNGNVTLVR